MTTSMTTRSFSECSVSTTVDLRDKDKHASDEETEISEEDKWKKLLEEWDKKQIEKKEEEQRKEMKDMQNRGGGEAVGKIEGMRKRGKVPDVEAQVRFQAPR